MLFFIFRVCRDLIYTAVVDYFYRARHLMLDLRTLMPHARAGKLSLITLFFFYKNHEAQISKNLRIF